MKNRFLSVLAMLCICLMSFADIKVVSGDLSVVKDPSICAKVIFDYTDLMLEGKPYMEQLKAKGDDFVRDWPTESMASEAYFLKCWNQDNDGGMEVSTAGDDKYIMYFHVKKMHMGSGAASMLVGFGAGGASMSGTMYIFKDKNAVPVLTVEIDNQTGRSGISELVRRTDLYGELAEDLVKRLKKTKQSKVGQSNVPVQVPNLDLVRSSGIVGL